MKARTMALLAAAFLGWGLGTGAATALADTRPLTIEMGKPWTHKETGIVMPATLSGFTLEEVGDYGDSESDLGLSYRDRASGTLLSIFLFRAGTADVSVWQDRVITTIRRNGGGLGGIDGIQALPMPITPANGIAGSGSIVTFHLSGGNSNNTGSAMLPVNGWLIAMRMSSARLTQQELSDRLVDAVAALSLPAPKNPALANASYAIQPCADPAPIALAERSAGGITEATRAWAGYAVQNAVLEKDASAGAGQEKPAPYCRESYVSDDFSVYSRPGRRDGYLIALQDAGATIIVAPPVTLWETSGKREYGIALATTTDTTFFRGFHTLPTIAQVIDAINRDQPIAKVGRTPGSSKQVNIFVNNAKDASAKSQ